MLCCCCIISGPVPPDGYAVVAYLHSGDFSSGSPFEINPFQFVFKQRLIVVTIAYRLHILGFFTTLDGEAPGNFGLMDQSAALMWIKENIKAFGGDDENVTLMGHGSGAASVSAHLLSKEWSDNFFDKAVIMSGSVLERGKVRMPHEYRKIIDKTADAFSCIKTPTSRLVECLRNLDAKSLVEEVTEQRWGPVVDKEITNTTVPFISDIPGDLVERGTLRKVPLLTGFTNQEDIYDLESEQMVEHGMTLEMFDLMIDEIIRADFARVENNETMCAGNNQIAMEAVNFLYRPYPPTEDKIKLRNFFVHFLNDRKYLAPTILTAAHMSKQSDTFVYRFDLKPRTMIDIPEDIGVPHGFEQVTIKNYYQFSSELMIYFQIFLWGLPYWGTSNITWDNNDKRVSDIIMTLWGNFMKFTNPTQFGVYLKWENFTHDIPNILIIDRSFNMSDFHSLNHHAIKFWNEYYPSVMGFATKCCNSTDDADMEGTASMNVSHYFTITMLLLVGQLTNYFYHEYFTVVTLT